MQVDLTENEVEEVIEALSTKINLIVNGKYGPETEPDENHKWTQDLCAIISKLESLA
jgi:hypothetical protein